MATRAFLWTSVGAFLLGGLRCCFGQTDDHLLATGHWSEIVHDHDEHATWGLRGRLLVYDNQSPNAANHARVYLELQNVFEGGWSNPVELYFVAAESTTSSMHFEVRDAHGKPIPEEPIAIRGLMPYPYDVVLPCDSTIRLRVDNYLLGLEKKPDGLEILVNDQDWIIRPTARNEFFLSADFCAKNQPASPQHHVWQGTLHLPAVKIPVPR